MSLPVHQVADVVGRQPVYKRDRIGPVDPDLAHMRNIKQPGRRPAPQMLFDNARQILHRHIPTAKIDHPSAKFPMDCVERSFLKFIF